MPGPPPRRGRGGSRSGRGPRDRARRGRGRGGSAGTRRSPDRRPGTPRSPRRGPRSSVPARTRRPSPTGPATRPGRRGVERPVRLHPEHGVALVRAGGQRLHVGHGPEQPVGRVAAVGVPELPPVADVHDGGAGQVVGVERALAVGVRVGVIRAAAEPSVRPVREGLRVGPQDPQRGLLGHAVRRVAVLRRRRDRVAEEVEVGEVRQRGGDRGGRSGRGDGRRRGAEQERERDEHGEPGRSTGIAARVHGPGHQLTPARSLSAGIRVRRATPILQSAIP